MSEIAVSVLIYLGIPFVAGMLIRFVLIKVREMNMTKNVMSAIQNTSPAEKGAKAVCSRLRRGTVGVLDRPANANLSTVGLLGDQMRNQELKMSLLGACLASCAVSQVSAQVVVFEDNFDNENGGIGEINYLGFPNGLWVKEQLT